MAVAGSNYRASKGQVCSAGRTDFPKIIDMTASKAERDKLFVPIDHDFPALNKAYSNLTEDDWLQSGLLRRKGSMPRL
jgi:hypothetical protein